MTTPADLPRPIIKVDAPAWARRRKHPRDPETGFLKPRQCALYRAGHTVHWIQAKRSHGEDHRSGRLVGVEDYLITIDFGDEIKRYRNHEVERLAEIIGIDGPVRVCDNFVILRFDQSHFESSCFSIAAIDKPWILCNHKPLKSGTPEALGDRLKTHGGFSVPAKAVLDSLDEEPHV